MKLLQIIHVLLKKKKKKNSDNIVLLSMCNMSYWILNIDLTFSLIYIKETYSSMCDRSMSPYVCGTVYR